MDAEEIVRQRDEYYDLLLRQTAKLHHANIDPKQLPEAPAQDPDRPFAVRASDLPRHYARTGPWGPWRYEADHVVLVLGLRGRDRYEVDLETCTSTGQVLDWLAQVLHHFGPYVAGCLIHAFDDLLGLQEYYCGSGEQFKGVNPLYLCRAAEKETLRAKLERH